MHVPSLRRNPRVRRRPYWQARPFGCVCESPVCPYNHVPPMTLREVRRRIGA